MRTVIPFLRCEVKNSGLTWPTLKTFGILAIAVDPDCGRRGYGSMLMEVCDQIAIERGFSRMQLRVNPANKAAIAFYQNLGWSKLEENGPWTGVMFKPVS